MTRSLLIRTSALLKGSGPAASSAESLRAGPNRGGAGVDPARRGVDTYDCQAPNRWQNNHRNRWVSALADTTTDSEEVCLCPRR